MTAFRIPLAPTPQTLSIRLNGSVYNLTLIWCAPAAAWILDIADANNNTLVNGIPLVTGLDLLAQYKSLGIAGQLFAQTIGDADMPPNFTNLGTAGNLYFVTPS